MMSVIRHTEILSSLASGYILVFGVVYHFVHVIAPATTRETVAALRTGAERQ